MKLGEDRWRISVDRERKSGEDRKRIYRIVQGPKGEAETKLAQLKIDAANGRVLDGDKSTVDELFAAYIERKIEVGDCEPTTISWYTKQYETHIRRAIGGIRLRDLTKADVSGMISKAVNRSRTTSKGKPLGPSSRRNLRVAISAILEWAVDEEQLARNVASGLQTSKLRRRMPNPMSAKGTSTHTVEQRSEPN